jgi:23S rRNA pseudouridine1911/1915/1917 synthase
VTVAIGGSVADRPSILLERSGVVAILKPSGLATQAPPGVPSVESWLRDRLPAGAYLGVPHRLDRAVSGVLLMTTTPRAARQLSRQFERRQIGKTYVAILATPTAPSDDAIEWRDRIAKRPDVAAAAVVGPEDTEGREAVTVVRLLGQPLPGLVLVELRPVTGRMHQLRVQAASRGMPVVGDSLYGGPPFGSEQEAQRCEGERDRPIALHALAIRFRDPDSPEEITVSAPPPGYWPVAAADLLERA